MIGRIPIGRLLLFSLITAALFGAFSLLHFLNPFFTFYTRVALYSLMASGVCLVLWLIRTLFRPSSLLNLSRPGDGLISNVGWLNVLFCKIPHFRISIVALAVSMSLFWLHSLVFPIGITVFIVTLDMVFARLLFR